MQQYQPGDVLLLTFPFVDEPKTKKRPALALLDCGDDDIVVARITSHKPESAFDIVINQWQQAGLLLPSIVRIHKLVTINKNCIEKYFGRLSQTDWKLVHSKIQELWK